MKKNYKKLYLHILEIGVEQLDTGLTYEELKCLLEKKGYNFSNNCIEIAVKQWFFDCFHHKTSNDAIDNIDDIDDHLECSWILKGESCLILTEYKASSRNLNIAIIAIIISVVSLISQFTTEHLDVKRKEHNVSINKKCIIHNNR